MDAKGGFHELSGDGRVLHWSGRVLSALDLRGSLNGHRELVVSACAIVTPLAADELRSRGVQLTRQAAAIQPVSVAIWGYAQERREPMVGSVLQSLSRDGVGLKEFPTNADASPCRWAAAIATYVAKGEFKGVLVFSVDAGLFCCVANKVPGVRAVAVASAAQASRATTSLGANVVAIETTGRTFHEVRQILRTLCVAEAYPCPPDVASTLEELDGHAHR